MSFAIRHGRAEDSPALVDLLCRQMREHSLPADPKAIMGAVEQAFVDSAKGRFLVAESSGEIIGLAYVASLHSMEHAQTISLLEELYLLEPFRGKGIGRALLRRVLEEFAVQLQHPVELEVDSTHQHVESFYEREGFTRRERSRWIFVPPADA